MPYLELQSYVSKFARQMVTCMEPSLHLQSLIRHKLFLCFCTILLRIRSATGLQHWSGDTTTFETRRKHAPSATITMTGFLDLPGKLRNVIYTEYISQVFEEKAAPRVESCALLRMSPQIRSEALSVSLLLRSSRDNI